jgi:hypothetical protein
VSAATIEGTLATATFLASKDAISLILIWFRWSKQRSSRSDALHFWVGWIGSCRHLMEELNFLVITVCVGEMVSILQTNPSRNVGNFTANYDITIGWRSGHPEQLRLGAFCDQKRPQQPSHCTSTNHFCKVTMFATLSCKSSSRALVEQPTTTKSLSSSSWSHHGVHTSRANEMTIG